jgi:hypothetical protein
MPFFGSDPADRVLGNTFKDHTTGCWVFRGGVDGQGYGVVKTMRDGKTVTQKAHRVVFQKEKGRCPEVLKQRCENRRCVNPDHMDERTRLQHTIATHGRRPAS